MGEYLVLWAWFSPAFVRQELIPEIEKIVKSLGYFHKQPMTLIKKINLRRTACIFIINTQRKIYPWVRSMKRLHIARTEKFSILQYKNVHQKFCAFLRLTKHSLSTMLCADIMSLA